MSSPGPKLKYADTDIAQLMKSSGLTDLQIAQLTGVPRKTVQNWRLDDCNISMKRYKEVERIMSAQILQAANNPKIEPEASEQAAQ